MKRFAYTIFAVVLVIAATLKTSAQSGETRQVSGFTSIASAGPFNVHVNINGTESLKIEASSSILSEIETVVEGGNLEIKFKHHHERSYDNVGKIDVYVTAKSLNAVTNAGSGSVKVEGAVTGDNVAITLSGSGDIDASVKSEKLHTSISGSGSIHLSGSAAEARVSITGSGEMKAKALKTGSTSVMITGSGSAYFSADKTVSAHIVGSGSVVYSGNASMSDVKTIGSGSVTKAD